MKKTLVITAVMVSLLLVLVFAGGCLGQKIVERVTEEVIEKAIESEGGGDVEIDLDEGEITIQGDDGEVKISADDETIEIQSDDGEVTIGTGADLPEGFPGNIPVYPDMKIATSWKASDNGKDSYSISAASDKSTDEIFNWYKDKLSGWDIEGEFTVNTDEGKTSNLTAGDGTYTVNIMVMETEDEGTIVVQNVVEE
jgi:hypothetical protein